MADYSDLLAAECRILGVSFEDDRCFGSRLLSNLLVQQPDKNMDVVKLEKAPKIAVYVSTRIFNCGMMPLRWRWNMRKFPTKKCGMMKCSAIS